MNLGDYPVVFNDNARSDYKGYIGLGRGVFGYRTFYNFSAITDGTSNTALFSERCISPPIGSIEGLPQSSLGITRIKDGCVHGGPGYSPMTYPSGADGYEITNRQGCLDMRGEGKEYKIIPSLFPQYYEGFFGWEITEGWRFHNGFHTILPPNAPCCIAFVDEWRGARGISMITPTSDHTGGVQLALVDGAVRFISDTIDIGTGNDATVSSGVSPFGVWGALGSRTGGEASSLP
jgi:hypothetical protein